MKLSVLIPTVTPRKSLLSRMLWSVTSQSGDFEVLVHRNDGLPMGDKLNHMFQVASGEYVVCVDDDDMLVDSYMETVLPRLGTVDFVGYRIAVLHNGQFWMEVTHRADVSGWGNGWNIAMRGVGPKCPIRRDLARQIPFGNEYKDDEPWSAAVGELVTTSDFIDRTLYVYDWWEGSMLGTAPSHYEHRWSTQRDVGRWPYTAERILWLD